MKFMSILLTEGRKEDLKKRYSEKFKEYPEQLDFVLNISDLIDFNHKYTDFVLKYLHPNASTDEVEEIVELVKDFDKYQSQFPKKDINQYVSIDELESVINFVRTKNKDKELEKQVNKIYEDNKFLVVKPKTEAASCKYGSNTKWCTTSKGGGHFERYTSGRQALYYIINKTKSTNKKYSKVAIHVDDGGELRYWDTQDSPMSQREIDVFEYAFPEMIEAINSDYKKYAGSMTDMLLTQAFDSMGENSKEDRNYLRSDYDLSSYIRGFQNVPDMGFGHSEARLSISLRLSTNDSGDDKFIDSYKLFITYKSIDEKTFTASIGFMGEDEVPGEDFENLGLEGWGIDVTYNLGRTPAETAEGVRRHIVSRVLEHIRDNPKLVQKVAGTSKVWRPDRFNYGYTFGKNKGLISKLVSYLDSGEIGTKLDFLESLGKLKSKKVDGKRLYAHSYSNEYLPSSKWRGQFSSFFASAKLAGILGYRKIGKDYFLVKGPNFDAFKSGKLKAL
jgi:hypothetical protein